MGSVEGRKDFAEAALPPVLRPLTKPKSHGTQAKPFACRLHAYEEGETRPRHVRSGSSRPRQYAISEKKQHKQDHQQHRREYACLSTALWICHTDLAAVGGYLALMQSIK